jgi:hypothetical protein
MKKTITSFFLIIVTFVCFILLPISASAIQSLGVAPGEPGSGGTYFGPTPNSSPYQSVFADQFLGGGGGFAMPSSGGLLSIWYGSSEGSPDPNKEIWLATTAAGGGSFKFGGIGFGTQPDNNLAVASYKPDVYGLSLGTLNAPNTSLGSWVSLDTGEFGTGKKEFYVLTNTIEYSNFESGDWMYAAITGSDVSDFSSRTTSTTTPVPATVWLFGSSLLGLSWLRRRYKK